MLLIRASKESLCQEVCTAWPSDMISIRAWKESPCQAVFKAWSLAIVSIRVWPECLFPAVCKAWALDMPINLQSVSCGAVLVSCIWRWPRTELNKYANSADAVECIACGLIPSSGGARALFLRGTKDVSWAQHVHRISHASYFPIKHVWQSFDKEWDLEPLKTFSVLRTYDQISRAICDHIWRQAIPELLGDTGTSLFWVRNYMVPVDIPFHQSLKSRISPSQEPEPSNPTGRGGSWWRYCEGIIPKNGLLTAPQTYTISGTFTCYTTSILLGGTQFQL